MLQIKYSLINFSKYLSTRKTAVFLSCLLIYYVLFNNNNWYGNSLIPSVPVGVLQPLGFATIDRKKLYVDRRKYLSSNLAASSRLGNHIFELSAILAMSRKLGRVPTFFIQDNYHDQMLMDTDVLIPGLVDHFLIINQSLPISVTPVDFHMVCCIYDDPDRLKNVSDQYLHIKGMHFQSWKYFPRMRNELLGYLKNPTNNYTDLPKSNESNFLTCVHVRRTDFVGTGSHVPEIDFIISSMKYVEDREVRKDMHMLTVFFGDDITYLEGLTNESFMLKNKKKKDLKTESFISRDSPSDSLLYSRHHCDVVFFTAPHSTFGWWMGFFSKGNQVYYTDIKYTNDTGISQGVFKPEDYFPPHWIPIKYDGVDNATVVETL